jgi:hypothetical protein
MLQFASMPYAYQGMLLFQHDPALTAGDDKHIFFILDPNRFIKTETVAHTGNIAASLLEYLVHSYSFKMIGNPKNLTAEELYMHSPTCPGCFDRGRTEKTASTKRVYNMFHVFNL